MQKKKSPAVRTRRTSQSNTLTREHIGIERVFASCVHELLLQTPQIAFGDLRARVRDWATRGELVAALTVLELARHRHNISVYGDNDASQREIKSTAFASPLTKQTDYEGGDQPHNNMPPFAVVNYIITY